jgi:uncharacterized protein (TIGR03083 family)
VETPALIAQLAADGPRLIDAAQRAGWDAPVPATDWTVRELVVHVGGVHRWAADIVASRRDTTETAAGDAVGTGPGDDELAGWFRAGHAALVETLRAAPADLECVTFLPADSPLHFWARRQAHETAIHRVDAEGAAGEVTPFDVAFARDGIAELLDGFAHRRRKRPVPAATIGLHAEDGPSWLVTLGGERVESRQVADPARLGDVELTVRGSSSDLYLWLWNRPGAALVEGDQDVAALWATTVRVRWS